MEQARLKDRKRLEVFCSILSVIAWQVMWLYLYARVCINHPCRDLFSSYQQSVLKVMCCKQKQAFEHLTIQQAIVLIARLGGFLARKSDGPPGMMTLWRGWKVFSERVSFLHELKEQALI